MSKEKIQTQEKPYSTEPIDIHKYARRIQYNRRSDEKFSISSKNLKEYMIPKKRVKVTRESIEKTMKGIPYTKSPSGYIFRKK